MSRFLIVAVLVMGLTAAPVGFAAADDSTRAAEIIAPAKPQAHKPSPQASIKKPKPFDPLLGNSKTLSSQSSSSPTVSLKSPPPKDDPFHLGARWSVSNDPNYGLGSTTTQTDILKGNVGQPTAATRNKFDLGVDYKF
jgi:hypothetical protein